MFKVIIDENETMIQGNKTEMLAGLACYVEAFKKGNFSENLIRKTVELGLKDEEELEKEFEKDEQKNNEIEEILRKIFE